MLRQHAPIALVAVGVVAAAALDGLLDPAAYAAASILIWAAILAGIVSRLLPLGRVATPALVAAGCLGATALLAGASISWTGDNGRAFEEAVRASAYLGLFTLAICTSTDSARDAWLGGLTIGLSVVSALSVAHRLQPELWSELELEPILLGVVDRLSYPVGYWNGLGALLAVAAIMLAWAGTRAASPRVRATTVAAMPVPLLGLYLTASSGGAAAFALGLAVLVATGPQRARQLLTAAIGCTGAGIVVAVAGGMQELMDGHTFSDAARDQGDLLTLVLLTTALLTGLVAALADRWSPGLAVPPRARGWTFALAGLAVVAGVVVADPVARFEDFREPPQPGVAAGPALIIDAGGGGRWQLWEQGVKAFESHPAGGVGAGGYEDWWAEHASIELFVRNPHSLPVQALAELGLAGFLLLLGFAASLGLAGYRALAAGRNPTTGVLLAVIAAGGLAAAIDWGWMIPAVAAPAIVAAALLTASAPQRGQPPDRILAGVAALAVAWIALIAAGLVVLGELKLDQSRTAFNQDRPDDAIERAQEARTVQPWSSEPYVQLALLEEEGGDLDASLEQLDRAISRDPDDWRLALIQARLLTKRGDLSEARAAQLRARALNELLPPLAEPAQ